MGFAFNVMQENQTLSAEMIVRSLQCWHRRRASRWATTQSMAEDTRKVSTSISVSRVIADAASLVWSEDRTR